MVNTKVTLSGWQLDNPIIPASGTFGYGVEFKDFYDINILGVFLLKEQQKILVLEILHLELQKHLWE